MMNRIIKSRIPKKVSRTRGLLTVRGLNRLLKLSAMITACKTCSSSSTFAFSFPAAPLGAMIVYWKGRIDGEMNTENAFGANEFLTRNLLQARGRSVVERAKPL